MSGLQVFITERFHCITIGVLIRFFDKICSLDQIGSGEAIVWVRKFWTISAHVILL